ncbi:hypothetical protein ACFO3D_15175 [Virgibacillus kekensis]|uniref:Uncharacterized protein n=1 Tax=Virgibacillus kekensis TaxID=202261 RepID=A0ABV9DL11_9BACI
MYYVALLYLACILAGFALANVPVSSVVTTGLANFLDIIGGLVIIVFAGALIYYGLRVLFGKN